MNNGYDIPILFITFNRPNETKKVFEAIKNIRPRKLYVSSDGPRKGVENESSIVNAIRDYINSNIDWKCELFTMFQENNLGCGMAVSSAIDWFFANEEKGVILEDDCLPLEGFFEFVQKGLNYFKDDLDVFSLAGNLRHINPNELKGNLGESIYFNMWGWATWKNRWVNYDYEFFDKHEGFDNPFYKRKVVKYWEDKFLQMKSKQIDTWDYQAIFHCFMARKRNIYPSSNLVLNIGFGENAAHTKNKFFRRSLNRTSAYLSDQFSFSTKNTMNIDFLFENEFSIQSYFQKLLNLLFR